MTTNDIENFDDRVKQVITDWFVNEGFKARKLTDTPTDSNQVAPKGYVDTVPVADTQITFTDNTTGNVSITKHGFAPKAPNSTTQFLRGDATWAAVPSPTPAFTNEGSLTWSNETTDKTLTFTNAARALYIIYIALSTGAALDIQLAGDTGSNYSYLTGKPNSATLTSSGAGAGLIRLADGGGNAISGQLTLGGANGGRYSVTGPISSNNSGTNGLILGSWSGGISLNTITFLVNGGTTTGTIHAYSLGSTL